MKDRIEIARLGKAVGLMGEQKCYLLTDFPEQFEPGKTFFVKNNPLTIEYFDPERELIKFREIHSREAAQKYTNLFLLSDINSTRENCELDEGEHFWFDIIGCQVKEENLTLGVVTDIQRIGNTDYLLVNTDSALTKSRGLAKSFLIPYIDPYVLEADTSAKAIRTQNTLALLEES